LASARDQGDVAGEWIAEAAEAAAASERAEQRLSQLEAERMKVGRRAGGLRATLAEFDTWARTTGQMTEAA
jgi:hypothetical protein